MKKLLIIAGPLRTGTSSLFWNMAQHPEIGIPGTLPKHELKYFTTNYGKGRKWFMKKVGRRDVGMDGTPYYFHSPEALKRIRKDFPKARIVITLREPVARIWSLWGLRMNSPAKRKSSPPYPEVVDKLLEDYYDRVRGERKRRSPGLGLIASMYHIHLRRWFEVMGKENVLVLQSEKMFKDWQATVDRICGFMGIDFFEIPIIKERLARTKIDLERFPEVDEKLRAFFEWHNEELYKMVDWRWDV